MSANKAIVGKVVDLLRPLPILDGMGVAAIVLAELCISGSVQGREIPEARHNEELTRLACHLNDSAREFLLKRTSA